MTVQLELLIGVLFDFREILLSKFSLCLCSLIALGLTLLAGILFLGLSLKLRTLVMLSQNILIVVRMSLVCLIIV